MFFNGELNENSDINSNTSKTDVHMDSASVDKFNSLLGDGELKEAKSGNNIIDAFSKFSALLQDKVEQRNNMTEKTENKNEKTETNDIEQQQWEAIYEGIKKLAKGELTTAEKGNLCEMMMDQYYISQGYTPIHSPRVTSLDSTGHQGIDGVYERTEPDGTKKYVIVDAKYDQSTLATNVDGTKQMSDKWIDDRLDVSVGKEKADEIRMADLEGNVSTEVFHMKPDGDNQSIGNCDVRTVDDNGDYDSPKENVAEYSEDDVIFKESDSNEG